MRVGESQSNFSPAPQGLHHAVCCEIKDLGMVDSPWGSKPTVLISWQLGEEDPDTKRRFRVFRRYNATLGKAAKPSNLRADLESWRGRAFTQTEAESFDLDSLLGKNCQISIVHALKDGTTYANVKTVVAAPKGVPPLLIVKYDDAQPATGTGGKKTAAQPASAPADPDDEGATDEDDSEVPF